MVAVPLEETGVTLDDLLQREGRAEVYDGEVVHMSAAGIVHNVIINNVWRVLDSYLQSHDLGIAFGDGATFLMFSPFPRLKDSFEPDVSFLSKENVPAGWDIEKPHPGAPDFAVEVISPDDRADRVQYKAQTYLEKGAKQVWLVYPRVQQVHVYVTGQARIYGIEDTVDLGDLFPGLPPISVKSVFDLPEWLKQQNPSQSE
jgi:Uma2 family endonuclease